MDDWIGYRWLAGHYGVEPVQPLAVVSKIGKSRSSLVSEGWAVETYLEAARPEATLAGQLTFALKREGVHLEFLARLFQQLGAQEMSQWVRSEPSGQYARRAGFFYEWLTRRELDFAGVTAGNYVSALPEADYFTASEAVNVPRWRVRDNLPGTVVYCPLVRRSAAIRALESYDPRARLHALEEEFGLDTLQRSAVWLTIRESRASFQIEHEEAKTDRVQRFASAMEHRIGTETNPLDLKFLALLQREILGERALRYGLRRSPIFVGESTSYGQFIHYVAPRWDQARDMLEGLHNFATHTRGKSPLLRAAVLSFGFVYLHPMSDGNGRISRFLVNDTLRRDGAAPKPFILPVSATITRTVSNRAAYDRALEQFSRPFMERFRPACSFGERITCGDGVQTDFHFSAYDEAHFTWAFPDLTAQTEYLGAVIRETIETEMRQQARFLLEHHQLRERVKNLLEAPDMELDRIIRSIQQNGGTISGKLAKEFPVLTDPTLASQIIATVQGTDEPDEG